jgi:hypothetical protein
MALKSAGQEKDRREKIQGRAPGEGASALGPYSAVFLARLLSQFAINHIPGAPRCHSLEHDFGSSSLDLVANPELPLPAASLAMVIIQQQGGTSYDPETGKLVRIELWGPEQRPQYSLEAWSDVGSAEKAFWAGDVKWQE